MDEAWLDTVRLARDCGDISSLFPPGVTSLVDLPYNIHNAILQALGYLSFESLAKDEKPPRKIWTDADAMKEHWDQVEKAREAKYNPNKVDTSGMDESPLKSELLVGFDHAG